MSLSRNRPAAPSGSVFDVTSPVPEASTTSPDVLAVISTASWVGLGVVAWAGCGVVAALVLRRRGHDLRSLLGLALVLGPLFVPLALDFVRNREPAAGPIVLLPTPAGDRPHVVVVVLGDGHDAADAAGVLDRFGPPGAVTVATTIDFETADRPDTDETRVAAERRLAAAATLLPDPAPGRVLLPGTLERSLPRLVTDRHDLVVVTGATDDVGAERVSDRLGIPVVVVPASRPLRP